MAKRLLVDFRSADVIHDFWVPELGRKIDIVPGHPNRLWIEADHGGTYLGACAEFCGNEHAWMRFLVIAQSARGLRGLDKRAGGRPAQARPRRGAARREDFSRQHLHQLPSAQRRPRPHPLASRHTLAAGALENTPENLAAWLNDPDHFKPGSNMPNFKLSDDEVRALVAYLEAQK